MPLVDVRQLNFLYPDGTEALRGVSFSIEPAERVGLIGPNGAGKSTLLWHLNGLLPERFDSASAAVTVAGIPVRPPHLPEVRRTVGLVFQDPDDQLFCPTVGEDIAFGPRSQGLPPEEVRQRVAEALRAVDLLGLEDRMPQRLSIGQRRRATIAGVLACRPQLLALDEPTANLDPRGRRQLADILGRLDCAVLVASHDLELILAVATRVILLDQGQVIRNGPARDVLADEALMLAHGLECPSSLRHRPWSG